MSAAVAACAVAGAVLLGSWRPGMPVLYSRPSAASGKAGVLTVGAVAGVIAVVIAVASDALWMVWLAGVGVIAVAGAAGVGHRRRRDRNAATTAMAMVEICEHLGAELAAGRPPGLALSRLADGWPVLSAAADADRVGLDVPQALRAEAHSVAGASSLRLVAAAWQVGERSGGGIAAALDAIAVHVREAQSAQRVVDAELASARATARLVAVLPIAALAMGSGVGGNPWHFLLHTPVGTVCAVAGILLALAGLAWIDAIARAVQQ